MPAGGARSYSDFYKNRDKTLNHEDEEADNKMPGFSISITTGSPTSKDAGEKLRREALKRRLARKKKAGM